MGKYKIAASCKKCGEIGARSIYYRFATLEHIKRICNNCGYTWQEEPLDSYEKGQEEAL